MLWVLTRSQDPFVPPRAPQELRAQRVRWSLDELQAQTLVRPKAALVSLDIRGALEEMPGLRWPGRLNWRK